MPKQQRLISVNERNENMKAEYTAPEMEIITFDNEDVITTSDTELEPQ